MYVCKELTTADWCRGSFEAWIGGGSSITLDDRRQVLVDLLDRQHTEARLLGRHDTNLQLLGLKVGRQDALQR